MRRTAILSLLAVVTTAYGVPAPFPKPESRSDRRTELDRLQGAWEGVEFADRTARTKFSEEGVAVTFVIEANRARIRVEKGGRWQEFETELTLDPQATPKKVIWKLLSVRTENRIQFTDGDPEKELGIRGLYRLAGNELIICVGNDETTHPSSFDVAGDDGKKNCLIVCRRKR